MDGSGSILAILLRNHLVDGGTQIDIFTNGLFGRNSAEDGSAAGVVAAGGSRLEAWRTGIASRPLITVTESRNGSRGFRMNGSSAMGPGAA